MINPMRHLSVFKPSLFGKRRVDVIGAGATGSRIAIGLAKLGVQNLHIWDFDKVEEHNLANQSFYVSDVGKPKVEALAAHIKNAADIDVVVHNAKVTGTEELGEVVFLLTDTMQSRKEIFEGALRKKFRTQLMIETRMGTMEGRIYTLNPCHPKQVSLWESHWYPDKDTEESACGSRSSVGPTAEIVSGFALSQFVKWHQNLDMGLTNQIEFEILFYTNPFTLLCQQ